MIAIVKNWGPVLLYALLITGLSSIPAYKLPPQGFKAEDKVLHVILYSGAGAVLRHAVPWTSLAIVGASAYGGFDEYYQHFIPGRNSSVSDWIADTIGGTLGACLYAWYQKRKKRSAAQRTGVPDRCA